MSCRTQGEFVGPYISDPFAYAQALLECDGLCSINGNSCFPEHAVADCATADLVPDNYPVNL